ncbi:MULTISPECIES: tRNA (uridine(34)/cytosine(34)/5-carboxymethylaminomethyluridine(34)-2'-O)-methyltransferase TrmL [unclassified Paludibacterium]|uniref:tRNA (uridine(34)/cytosine(34)/5- carboxymethylaminomethyluridine(34)-2'-O)- methyltransferase TrmL n=1 Tax=unclassified Paludibacterium TaxID=2618429 RepID=UPI001C04AD4B|nr:tRNA (uridine(34)/cytosine(34)/5-carboxymethylaminomethyluridine(34)-2'-O)-methyltransferase TrmL [Paludibacterium sp. B53371]BEV72534.1 tRNA (uridine(34)/cytosine(34)/5-carboxymethylaminomethyluridine (34)-2'-O)-methyltransferase TrmL [Paludibacterium sp. THUN1379]
MFTVVLFQPEIPPNTGNVIRLCANTGCELHLVKPLGFPLDDAKLRRAGLDYHEYAKLVVHENWESCLASLQGRRIFAATTKGATRHDQIVYRAGDVFLFGPESRGLPDDVLAGFPHERRIRLPMQPESRSMNLSNAVAVTVYEAWRQIDFLGGS